MRVLATTIASAVMLFAVEARAETPAACVKAAEASQELRDQGHYLRARQELLRCSSEGCPPQVRTDCLTWLGDLERTAPSLVVHPKGPSGEDVVDVTVSIDGTQIVSRLDGKPILVDPGPHTVRYESAGFTPVEQKVLVNAGEKNRVLAVTFARAQDASQPAPVTTSRGGPPAIAWVLGGVAVVALGTGAFFGLQGLSERSDLWSSPCSEAKNCAQSDVDSVRTKFLVADVAGAVGIVSAVAAGYFFLTAPKSTVGVGMLPGGGSVRFSTSF